MYRKKEREEICGKNESSEYPSQNKYFLITIIQNFHFFFFISESKA